MIPFSFIKEIIDIIFFYKSINKMYDVDINSIVSIYNDSSSITRRGQQGVLINQPFIRTERARSFFSSRICPIWNSLPNSIRTIHCNNELVRPLRTLLSEWYLAKTITMFDITNTCTWVSHCRCFNCRPT